MKKRELIYLHGLLAEVRRYLDTREDLPAQPFADYEEYGVFPTAIHRSKADHQEAIRRLLKGLTAALAARQATSEPKGDVKTES